MSVHNSVTLAPGDHQAAEALTRYMMRLPVSLARLKLVPGQAEVLHFPKGSGDDPGSAQPERIDALDYVTGGCAAARVGATGDGAGAGTAVRVARRRRASSTCRRAEV